MPSQNRRGSPSIRSIVYLPAKAEAYFEGTTFSPGASAPKRRFYLSEAFGRKTSDGKPRLSSRGIASLRYISQFAKNIANSTISVLSRGRNLTVEHMSV